MSTSMADLGFNIDSKPMKKASSELDKMSGAAGRAEKSAGGLSSAATALKGALIGLAGALSVREVVQMADAWRGAENQLKQVTSSAGELASVQSQLIVISKETRSNFESTANLYARLARSTDQMGLSQKELLDITKSINQSFAASGATATEASAAITQLSQGLAAGALRGDEFNSVAEQAPGIMRAIASSLNMTIGELRAFAAEGGITSEIVVNAMQKASDTIANEFGQTIATFGQSMEVARTNMLEFVGTSSAINGAVSSAGDAVVFLSDNIQMLTTATAGLLAAGIAGYMISAAGAMSMYQIVLKGALATQIAFNAVAAINPYVLIGAAVAGSVAAIYAFTSAQESAIEVWERAKESESSFQAAMQSISAENRIQEIVKDRMDLEKEKQDLEESGMQNHIYNKARYAEIQRELNSLESEYHDITNARIEATKASSAREAARQKSEAEAKQRQIDLEKTLADAKLATAAAEQKKADAAKAEEMADWVAILDEELSQLQALKDAYGDTTKAASDFASNVNLLTQMFNMTGNQEYIRMIEKLAEDFSGVADVIEKEAEDSSEAFVNEWQSVADSVANSLQDAIASGDWKTLGDGIGNALATSISGIVSKSITDSLSKNLTANSSVLAQIGGAFAGPIAGAIAGAAIQIAVSEVMDYLSDDFDPTEARQAAQGTGTVLGSINAKSESIAEATEATATASEMLIVINRDMLRALLSLQAGISGATARVARGAGAVGFNAPTGHSGAQALAPLLSIGGTLPLVEDAVALYLDGLSIMTLGLLDFNKLLGSRAKKKDEGVQIIGGYITDLIDETIVNAYQTFRVKKHALDDYDTKELSKRIGGDVERQFALVFESIFDSVGAAADSLGIDAMAAMQGFQISSQRISLEGLDAEAQQAELQAYFGTVFDQLAESAVPFLTEFQKAGEGLGETLARVANEVQVTREAVSMLGGQFSDLAGADLVAASERLVELNGGIEQFITNTQGFVKNFASETRQFEINSSALSRAMGALPLPETRQGFFDLMSAQDAATQEGAENIATLLRLQGTADQYYDTIEKAQQRYFESEISGQRDRLNEAVRAQSAVESALGNMILDSRDTQAASRSNAIMSLEQMARSGRVRPSDSLDRNLSAATAIQASDFSTFGEYVRDYTRTTSTLIRLKEITDEQVSVEERMLNRLEKQLEAVQGLRKDLEISQLAIIKQTNKTAGILERMELDGIEIRA